MYMKTHDKPFLSRMEFHNAVSYGLMETLFTRKIISKFDKAITEEDKEGVDYFFKWAEKDPRYSDGRIRIQFKNREDTYPDFPVLRFQPLYGVDHPKNNIGRDYKALKNQMNDLYFTAIKPDGKNYSKILVIDSQKLFGIVQEAENEWFGNDVPWAFLTEELCAKTSSWNKKLLQAKNGVQAWFKRTKSEKMPKINLYVPKGYADQVIDLS